MNKRKKEWSNLQLRIVAGLAGAIILTISVFYSAYSFAAIFLIISFLTQWELYKLLGLDGNFPMRTIGCILGGLVFVITFLVFETQLSTSSYLLIFPLVSLLFVFKLYKKEEKPLTNVALTLTGIVYIALSFSLLIVAGYSQGNSYQAEIIMGILLLLWASDIGAYFAGKAFGKRKLFERVSPKKTWEGFLGGAVLSLITSVVLYFIFPWVFHLEDWVGLSVVIVIMGSYGDLVESQFKRSIMIKDSGSMIPGHGGFLDRFDGLLIATPFVTGYLYFFV